MEISLESIFIILSTKWEESINGKDSLQKFWKNLLSILLQPLTFTIVNISVSEIPSETEVIPRYTLLTLFNKVNSVHTVNTVNFIKQCKQCIPRDYLHL